MASQTRIIRFTWENGVNFTMDTKLGDASYVTIIEMEEDGCIADLWPMAQKLCENFCDKTITNIGAEMIA